MARAIPRRLLIHSAVLKSGKTVDVWGNDTWASETSLGHVRFEPTTKMKLSKDNKEIQCSLLMFFDVRNSTPKGTVFALGQTIHWNGVDHDIASIDYLSDTRLHHVELGLV